MRGLLATASLPFLLAGCGLMDYNPHNDPVMQETFKSSQGEIHLGAIRATHRAVIGTLADNVKFCAEPPPDMANAVSEAITAALKAEVQQGADKSAGLDASAARAVAQTVEQLYSRSHGIQYLRDASYSLCQGYVNGALATANQSDIKTTNTSIIATDPNATIYALLQEKLLDNTKAILVTEIPAIYSQELAKAQTENSNNIENLKALSSLNTEQLNSILAAIKSKHSTPESDESPEEEEGN